MSDDYQDFMIATARQVAMEELEKFDPEIAEDITRIMSEWGDRLMNRVISRMNELGIDQDLELTVSWDPVELPKFAFRGATHLPGEDSDEQQD